MENIQNINIDIMNNKHSDYIYAKQYDHNRIVDFTITENGKKINLDNVYCTFLMKGEIVLSFANLVRNGDVYRLVLTNNETHEAGKIPYQLVLSSGEVTIDSEGHIVWQEGSTIIGTITSYVLVEACVVNENDIETQFDDNILERLLAEVQKAERVVDVIEADKEAADASATKAESYAIGGTESRTGEDTDNSKYYSEVSKSYAVGGTEILHDGEPDTRDNAKYYYEQARSVYDKVNFLKAITIPVADPLHPEIDGWNISTKTQIVEVEGVLANETQQLIVVRPTYDDMDDYLACDVMCIRQYEDALEFKCTTIPSRDLHVYVMIQDVELTDKTKVSQFIVSDTEPEGNQMSQNDFWVQPYE